MATQIALIFQLAELEPVLSRMDAADLSTYGLVIEENLTGNLAPTSGHVRIAGFDLAAQPREAKRGVTCKLNFNCVRCSETW